MRNILQVRMTFGLCVCRGYGGKGCGNVRMCTACYHTLQCSDEGCMRLGL